MLTPLLAVYASTRQAPDPDASQLDYWPITGAVWATIGTTCTAAGHAMTYRLIFTDTTGTITGVSPPCTVTSAAGPADFGTVWLGTPGGSECSFNICGDRMALKVDSITGVWTLNAQTFTPPAHP